MSFNSVISGNYLEKQIKEKIGVVYRVLIGMLNARLSFYDSEV